MSYEALSHPKLRSLCKELALPGCSGKGVTKAVLIEKLKAYDLQKAKKTSDTKKGQGSSSGAPKQAQKQPSRPNKKRSLGGKTSSEADLKAYYGAKTANILRTLCVERLLSPCSGAGITKKVLVAKLVAHDLNRDKENASSKPSPKVKGPSDGGEPREKVVAPAGRARSESSSSYSDGERLNEKILSIEEYSALQSFCSKHLRSCQRANWGDLLASKNAKVHSALVKIKSATSWQTLYMRMIGFFSRFKNTKNLEFVAPESLHKDYGDVWIALTSVYPTIRRMAVQNNDVEVIKNITVDYDDAAKLYSKSGSKEMARVLFPAIRPADRAWAFYTSLSACNDDAIDVMKEKHVKFDLQKAIKASLSCHSSIKSILRDPIYKKDILKNVNAILSMFYISGSALGISELVLGYPSSINYIQDYHVKYLSKNKQDDALELILKSKSFSNSVLSAALEEAALLNSIPTIKILTRDIKDQQTLLKIFGSALRMNRLLVAKEIFPLIETRTLKSHEKALRVSLEPHFTGRRSETQKWAERVLDEKLSSI